MVNQQIYFRQECNTQVNIFSYKFIILTFLLSAVVAPAIDTTTGLQMQPTAAYTTLPAQYPVYAPTAIYSHLPTTTLIPSALTSPGKEG